jgi:hypothetical protein
MRNDTADDAVSLIFRPTSALASQHMSATFSVEANLYGLSSLVVLAPRRLQIEDTDLGSREAE